MPQHAPSSNENVRTGYYLGEDLLLSEVGVSWLWKEYQRTQKRETNTSNSE
jgi:hypothetical protein